jgi:hypothetical protein
MEVLFYGKFSVKPARFWSGIQNPERNITPNNTSTVVFMAYPFGWFAPVS